MSSLTTSFASFFNGWLESQQNYYNRLCLLSSQNNPDSEAELRTLVEEVLTHYQEYYQRKAAVADRNVFLLFSPPWLSTFERTLLWVAGFRPSITFNLLEKTVGGELTPEQAARVLQVKIDELQVERVMTNEMAVLQEAITERPWVELAAREQVGVQAADGMVDNMMNRLKTLVVDADYLRAETSRDIVDILTPLQGAKFLAAVTGLLLKVHAVGQEKDASR